MKYFLLLFCFILLSCSVLAQTVYDPSVEVPGYDADKAAGAFSPGSKKAQPLPAGKSGIKNAPSQNCYISPDGSYTAVPRNDDGFYGPIALGFDLQVYDQVYNEIYINTNGTVTFGNGSTEFDHSNTFPTCDKLTMAPFWSDVDTRQPGSGQIWYKSTGTHFIVTWDKVGYYNAHHDLKNSFQVVLTNGADPLLGNGNTIGYFYGDMQWTTGDASGGTTGFKGDAALVGMSQYCPALTKSSTNYIYEVFGYFSQDDNAFYDANDHNNGVHYLDNRCVLYSTISNLSPEISGTPEGDEITMEIGEEKELEIKITGPEPDQQVTAYVNTGDKCNIDATIDNGTTAVIKLHIKADTCNIGSNLIVIHGEDDHTDPQTTYRYLTVHVKKLDQTITFPTVGTMVNGSVVNLCATASSGLPVSYRVVSGPGSVWGRGFTASGAGTTVIEAVQEGNNKYNAAPPQTISVCVTPRIPIWTDVPPDRVCVNVEHSYNLRFQNGDVQYFWKSDEDAVITPDGSGAKVLWRTPGIHTLSVKAASNCGDTTAVLSINVTVHAQQVSGSFGEMRPLQHTTNFLPLTFSWAPVNNAVEYWLYIWKAGTERPAERITVTSPGFILRQLNSYMEYNEACNWQVVAKNDCSELESPVQTFTVCAVAKEPTFREFKSRVCIDQANNFLVTQEPGLTYEWAATGDAVITYSENNTHANIIWHTPGNYTLTVKAKSSCGDVSQPVTLHVAVDNLGPAGVFERMLPSDGNENNTLPVRFTWFPIERASSYELYIWPATAQRPAQSQHTTNGLQYIMNSLPAPLEYGKPIKWQIVAKNDCGQLEGPVQTFTMRHLPDLIIQNIQVPTGGFSGQPLTVSWEVKNIGVGSTLQGEWLEYVYLSKDALIGNDDVAAGSVTNLSSLDAGSVYTGSSTFTLPDGIEGPYYAIIRIEPGGVPQSHRENDTTISTAFTTIQLTPPPDLQVTSIVPPNFAFSGQPVKVEWVITNKGAGTTTRADWRDELYLSPYPELDERATRLPYFDHNRIIPANGTDTARGNFTLPEGIHGTYYFHVVADSYDYIYEHAAENNNYSRSEAIEVVLTPPADLIVSSITVQPAASNREFVKVSWTVENAGGSSTRSIWRDHIYLSSEKILDTTKALLLGKSINQTILKAGEQYTAGTELRIPPGITGPYYLHVLTDAAGEVFEYTYEQNNATATEQPLQIYTPDLTVSAVTLPVTTAATGDKLLISWTVKNTGTGNLPDTMMKDRVLLSKKSIPAEQDLIPVQIAAYSTGEIPAGMSLEKQAAIKIPYGLSGDYYVFVQTNHTSVVYETNSANNSQHSSAAIHITPGPWPDLQVVTIAPGINMARAGNELELAFRVENSGNRAIEDSAWMDRVYLSTITPFDSTKSILLRELEQQRTLQPQQGYDITVPLYLPHDLQAGNYFVYVLTDAKGNIGEQTAETNNVSSGSPVEIQSYPPVDLVVTKVTGPSGSRSGASVKVSWTVANNGEAVTVAKQWTDGLYISADAVWDRGDQFIKSFRHNGVLAAGAQYTDEQTVEIPNGIAGNYYLLMVTDTGSVQLDINRSNNSRTMLSANGTPLPVEVEATPPPDLVVTMYAVPAEGRAGQPFFIKWSVQNNGTGVTIPGSWTDKIFLSTDLQLDNTDLPLGTVVISKTLQPGEMYKDSLRVILPPEISGNYAVIVKADANNGVYEQNENNNTEKAITSISTAPVSDLIVSGVEVPLTAMAGEEVTIKWKLKNIGGNRADGILRNAVYLSQDKQKDIQDILLGIPEQHISLAPGEEVTLSLSARLSDVALKNYHAIIHANLLRNIPESDEANNILASAALLNIQVPELELEKTTVKILPDKAVTYYRISVPDSLAGESLLVTLKSGTANAANEIYIRYEDAPNRVTYDHAGNQPYTGNQEILVPELKTGTYYLMVTGTAGTTQEPEIFAGILRFGIRKADAGRGGNSGTVTVAVHGSKLGQVTELRLEADGRIVTAKSISVVNAAKIFAVFDLMGTTSGVYDIVAQNTKGETASLKNGFTIEEGGAGSLQTSVSIPPSTRPSNIVSIIVNFTNNGNTDILHPKLKLASIAGAPLSFTVADLSKNEHALIFSVQELNGPPGILRPGASGTVIIYTKALSALSFILTDVTNK